MEIAQFDFEFHIERYECQVIDTKNYNKSA